MAHNNAFSLHDVADVELSMSDIEAEEDSQASEGMEAEGPAKDSPKVAPRDGQPSSEQDLGEDLELLRSSWELASCVQFCRMFSPTLRLKVFSADNLEAALLSPNEHRVFLSDLFFKLLRPDPNQPPKEFEAELWNEKLEHKVNAQWSEQFEENPFAGKTFFTIRPMTRVGKMKVDCFMSCKGFPQD